MSAPAMPVAGPMQLGLYTFGELVADPHTGRTIGARQRLREIVDAAVLAEQGGLDVFGVGEHHRLDFAVSAPPVALAAIAQATSRIRLSSAVTVLSTADPVRVFEDFATVDLLAGGRTEIIAGRGAFVESFPLFGYRNAGQCSALQGGGEGLRWGGRQGPSSALNRAVLLLDLVTHDAQGCPADGACEVRT